MTPSTYQPRMISITKVGPSCELYHVIDMKRKPFMPIILPNLMKFIVIKSNIKKRDRNIRVRVKKMEYSKIEQKNHQACLIRRLLHQELYEVDQWVRYISQFRSPLLNLQFFLTYISCLFVMLRVTAYKILNQMIELVLTGKKTSLNLKKIRCDR